jgi:hypothetical protein
VTDTPETCPFSFAYSVFSRPECIGALEHGTKRILFLGQKGADPDHLIFYHSDIVDYSHYGVYGSDNPEVEMSENGFRFFTTIWGRKSIILAPVMKMSDCWMFKVK